MVKNILVPISPEEMQKLLYLQNNTKQHKSIHLTISDPEVLKLWENYVKKYENDDKDKTINIKQKKVQVKKIPQKNESESDSD